jgi:hypothetical protein
MKPKPAHTPKPTPARRDASADFAVASRIIEALEPLPPESRERVLRVVSILLGLEEPRGAKP